MRLHWRVADYGPPIYTSLTASEACELQNLATGKRVLEVGAAFGYSTVILASTAASVTSVDPHRTHESLGALHANLAAHGVADKVAVLVGTSQEMLPGLEDRSFDVVFIDGDHTAAGVIYDLWEALRLTARPAVIACHDWEEDTCPEVRGAVEGFWQPDHVTDTLAILRLA